MDDMNTSGRLTQQVDFIIEIDKIKHVLRRTRLFDDSRQENDAEHSWHLAMMACVLVEYSNEPVDLSRVIRMVLLHDIVEIDAGDTFIYDAAGATSKAAREMQAAERIFGLLPAEQKEEFTALWEEFEKRETPESKFAAALDRLEPLLQNVLTKGHAWRKHGIRREQVVEKNKPIVSAGSNVLWDFARGLIEKATAAGHLPA